ncbi:hypothetical protein, partial [Klebsiella pneumoniae]
SHRTSIKDGLGRHIGSCGPLNRNFPRMSMTAVNAGKSNFLINLLPLSLIVSLSDAPYIPVLQGGDIRRGFSTK